MTAYDLGRERAEVTGRRKPVERDCDWCAERTRGAIDLSDPVDAEGFAQGMADLHE